MLRDPREAQTTIKCTTRIHALGSDDANSEKKQPTKKTCTANKVKYTLNHSGVSVFFIYVEDHFISQKNVYFDRNVALKMRSK